MGIIAPSSVLRTTDSSTWAFGRLGSVALDGITVALWAADTAAVRATARARFSTVAGMVRAQQIRQALQGCSSGHGGGGREKARVRVEVKATQLAAPIAMGGLRGSERAVAERKRNIRRDGGP